MGKSLDLYIDLDGTILDVRQRLCVIYKDTVTELGGKGIPLRTYWRYKRTHIPEETIALRSCITDVRRYAKVRHEKLEAPVYLSYDKVLPQVLKSIAKLKENNRLILTTMRVNVENLYTQLRELVLSPLLDRVLVRGNSISDTKANMISGDIGFNPSTSIIVGDTENDILAGKSLSIRTVSVLSGIRDKNILIRYQPDYVIDNVGQLAELLGGLEAQA